MPNTLAAREDNRGSIKHNVIRHVLSGVLVSLFVANMFDPLGVLRAKYLASAAAICFLPWTVKYFYMPSRTLLLGLVLFVVWPMWSLFYGVVRGGDVPVAVSQVTPFLFAGIMALIAPALGPSLPLRMFYTCLLILALAVIAGFLFILTFPDSAVSQLTLEFLSSLDMKEGLFGTRTFGSIVVPMIYFGSTLFLVPGFVYYLFIGKLLRAGVILLALGLAFSKAGLTIAAAFGVYYALVVMVTGSPPGIKGDKKKVWGAGLRRFLPMLLLAGVFTVFVLSLPTFSGQIGEAWLGTSDTSLVRIGHLHSVIDLFVKHPSYLLIGQGAGISFYSLGEYDYVQSFEIDHLNVIRKFGLPWFIGFSAVVFHLAFKLVKGGEPELRAMGLALVSIYFAAGTNPVLISSLFITLTTLSYLAQANKHSSQNLYSGASEAI